MNPALLTTMSIDEAMKKQFELTKSIADEFSGSEFFNQGDLGVVPGLGRPSHTRKVENVLAKFFGVPSCALIRGAGTGSIRYTLSALLNAGDKLFMHKSPMYTTTKETVRMLGLNPVFVDFNNQHELESVLSEHTGCKVFYAQHSRQMPDDTYDLASLIKSVKEVRPELPIVVDDNYTVFKVPRIGVELGASYSCFSGFKLLGPPGIGMIVGEEEAINTIRQRNYSGGGQVQGYEAMELLRSLVIAPVTMAVQNEETQRLADKLNSGGIPQVEQAIVANAQEKNVIVTLKEPIAQEVIAESEKHGAAVYPVGAESRFEILPMIYRVSGSFLEANPELIKTGIRINLMRSGADLAVDILKKAIHDVETRFKN
ncbi:aminotransferase class V-fold PLP-dependent enzyme [Bacillus sp. T33-2]|uniref:aminotransferase class V-fold PLP-dependent enzyme n=1 Tax=Bacillus sp. T33-2 TaxID=2054168 RepID=UPI000C7733EB|nr:aminotransferase class V-fold PLP-dependent enzyme [Bacillus sp. T33-2]PLR94445.1 aminotransferase [Bacillus sp. T33-2]